MAFPVPVGSYHERPLFLTERLERDKPDPIPVQGGAPDVYTIYGRLYQGTDKDAKIGEMPSWDRVEQMAGEAQGKLVVIDIERWYLNRDGLTEVHLRTDYLSGVVDMFRAVDPGLRIGYYGLLPTFEYWGRDVEWRKRNSWLKFCRDNRGRFSSEGLADKVDVSMPSLYVLYGGQNQHDMWVDYAHDVIYEARKYDKQVYPFLWENYSQGNEQGKFGEYIGDEMMLRAFEVCYDHADGCVMWGGFGKEWSGSEQTWLPLAQKVFGDTRRGVIDEPKPTDPEPVKDGFHPLH